MQDPTPTLHKPRREVIRPTIAFVMPAYNARETIQVALESVLSAGSEWGAAPVIVVDNGSTDGSLELVTDLFGQTIEVFAAPKATISELRNLGVRRTQATLIAFIDADCVLSRDYCTRAHEALLRSGAAAVGSSYEVASPPHWIEQTWTVLHHLDREGEVEWIPGGNLVIRREVFDEVGGFDPELTTGEDVDLCKRVRAAGHTIYRDPSIVAVHLGNPRTLKAFFKQHWWHGMGAITGARRGAPIPLLMSVMHLLITVLSLVGIAVYPRPAMIVALLLGQAVVPSAAVVYRMVRGGQAPHPLRAVLLYWLYFLARITALGSATIGFPRPSRGRR